MPTATEKTNSQLIVDAVINVIKEYNPLLVVNEEEYRAKLTEQYELYLMSQVMAFLSPEQKVEFDTLLNTHPFDKQLHNEYLNKHISHLSDSIVDISQSFILTYKNMLSNMK